MVSQCNSSGKYTSQILSEATQMEHTWSSVIFMWNSLWVYPGGVCNNCHDTV